MSWWKDKAPREIAVGDSLANSRRFSIDKSLLGGWGLRIYNVSLDDSGVYICQINTKLLRERFISLSVSGEFFGGRKAEKCLPVPKLVT